jgi:hypothetical protein
MMLAQDFRAPVLDLDGVLTALGIAADEAESRIPCTVIRGHDGPRWILPHGSPLAQTLLRDWRPYGLLTRIIWLAVPLANRVSVLPLLPGNARSTLPSDASRQFLGHAGQQFDAGPPVILVGNSAITRKLLVFLEDRNLKRIVLAKVPLTPLARVSIGNEARVLESLNGRLHTPRLVYASQEAGIAMQEYLPGRLGSRRLKPEYVDLLLALAETGGRISLREHGWRLAERLRACPAYAENAARLNTALALLESDADLPPTLVHGDFAPWNIKELPGRACTLIDWEMARQRGLPLYDLCHFYYMQVRLFTPDKLFYAVLLDANAWRSYLDRLDLPASLLKPLAAAFLLETLARYWDGSETSADKFCLRQLDMLLRFEAWPGLR